MTTDYKVVEVELSYKNRVPYKERKKVQTSLDATAWKHFNDRTPILSNLG